MNKLVTAFLLLASPISFAANEVLLVQGAAYNIGCPNCVALGSTIAVDHLKTCPESLINSNLTDPDAPRCVGGQASIVYNANGEDWLKLPAQFVQQGDDGFDYWEVFEEIDIPTAELQLAIEYQIAGNSFWDNNQYQDYTGNFNVGSHLLKDKVHLVEAMRSDSGEFARLHVAVENIAYRKKIKLIFSNDGGNSWQTIDGSYTRPLKNNYEMWTIVVLSLDPLEDLRFAIKYEVNGASYWDNNNYKDYHLSQSELLFGH